jgi:hypothetical protein
MSDLAVAPHAPFARFLGLRELICAGCSLDVRGLQLHRLKNVTKLDLSNNTLVAHDLILFASALPPSLLSLDLSFNDLGGYLVNPGQFSQAFEATSDGPAALARALKAVNGLTELRLSFTKLGYGSAGEALEEILEQNTKNCSVCLWMAITVNGYLIQKPSQQLYAEDCLHMHLYPVLTSS